MAMNSGPQNHLCRIYFIFFTSKDRKIERRIIFASLHKKEETEEIAIVKIPFFQLFQGLVSFTLSCHNISLTAEKRNR